MLAGRVERVGRAPLAGTMLTAFDDARLETVSVFTQPDGHFAFPLLRPGTYRLRARLIGFADAVRDVALARTDTTRVTLTLSPTDDTNEQLPASAWFSLILGKWSDPKIRADFTLSCGNCHQIGAYRFRRAKTEEQWRSVLTRMMANLPPYFEETRETLVDNVLATYGPDATIPKLPVPPPPSGEILNAVLYYESAPRTAPAATTWSSADSRVCGRGLAGSIPVTTRPLPVHRRLAFDQRTGRRGTCGSRRPTATAWPRFSSTARAGLLPLPNLSGVHGAYPHTNRFDSGALDDATKSTIGTLRSPTAGPIIRFPRGRPHRESTLPIAYGCGMAPDIALCGGRCCSASSPLRAATNTMQALPRGSTGQRRLGADGTASWVPG
jgi:hypothetical protein